MFPLHLRHPHAAHHVLGLVERSCLFCGRGVLSLIPWAQCVQVMNQAEELLLSLSDTAATAVSL